MGNTMNYFYNDLFETFDDKPNSINIILHGCNAQGKMNSGFARAIRQQYPEAYNEYMKKYNKNELKLGTNILYAVSENLIICNAITQQFYGYDGNKYVSYDAIDACIKELNNVINVLKLTATEQNIRIHMPKIGSALGGGNWNIIESIIENNISNNVETNVYILE